MDSNIEDLALYTKDRKKLISYIGEDSKISIPQGVEVIGERAFSDRSNLVEILFPDSLRCVEDEAFSNCTSLKRINLPNNVTNLGTRCFYECI